MRIRKSRLCQSSNFRDVNVAAPLKVSVAAAFFAVFADFRDVNVAAPLKVLMRDVRTYLCATFPRR